MDDAVKSDIAGAGIATTQSSSEQSEQPASPLVDTSMGASTADPCCVVVSDDALGVAQLRPVMRVAARDGGTDLFCDPLTGLLAYPSFEQFVSGRLPVYLPSGVHLAIGDVDDLKRYVTQIASTDPTMFGHLAGNDCMRRVGDATLEWARTVFQGWQLRACGTFGGDEVIIAAAGGGHLQFVRQIRQLAEAIRSRAPRPCTFAAATAVTRGPSLTGAALYRELVASVDRALFDQKSSLRSAGGEPNGQLVDVGVLSI